MRRRRAWLVAPAGLALAGACASTPPAPASAPPPATAAPSAAERAREPVVGLPCEGCEAVFQGMPDSITSTSRIAPAGEPGRPMRITGTVRSMNGEPAPGIIVYAYHTNAQGFYPPDERFRGQAAHRHGLLRGWAQTASDGTYSFDTIQPAGYPDTDIPEHVHLHVIEPGRCTYYIDDILFDDDPRLTPEQRSRLLTGRGGDGLATRRMDATGTIAVRRDIVLGRGVNGYPPA